MRYIIKRISNRAEINKEIHPHQLRHSYATHLLNNGAPLEVIQSLMGHEKSETARIYSRVKWEAKESVLSEVLLNVNEATS
ncbi:tyrosine-type recombinase/integrase [Psychrobacillus sp. NPDC096426]|uniref:tyrosine-type recombinase/integrase n=1 Tax=Psychrobacillus sp. NPDC096426 TaxID=3364491 RepID=UPI003811BB60